MSSLAARFVPPLTPHPPMPPPPDYAHDAATARATVPPAPRRRPVMLYTAAFALSMLGMAPEAAISVTGDPWTDRLVAMGSVIGMVTALVQAFRGDRAKDSDKLTQVLAINARQSEQIEQLLAEGRERKRILADLAERPALLPLASPAAAASRPNPSS